jgi:hypothetical protein
MTTQAKFEIVAQDKTAAAFNSAKKNVEGLARSFDGLKLKIAGGLGALGFGDLIKNAVEAGSKIYDLSNRIGVTTQALSQYQHVAKQSGIDFNQLTTAWETLNKNAIMAEAGFGRAKRAFDALFNKQQLADLLILRRTKNLNR